MLSSLSFSGISARTGAAVVALKFMRLIVSAIAESDIVTRSKLLVRRQKTFYCSDDPGGCCTVIRAFDAGQGAVRSARGLDQSLRLAFRSSDLPVGNYSLFQARRVASITDVAGVVDR